MKNRIKIMLAGLIMALTTVGLLNVSSPTAFAASGNNVACSQGNHQIGSGSNIVQFCLSTYWQSQPDGTGIILKNVGYYLRGDVSELEGGCGAGDTSISGYAGPGLTNKKFGPTAKDLCDDLVTRYLTPSAYGFKNGRVLAIFDLYNNGIGADSTGTIDMCWAFNCGA